MKELECGPRGMIDQLMNEHPDSIRHNSLEPTHVMKAESTLDGVMCTIVLAQWACSGVEPDFTVHLSLPKGTEAKGQASLDYMFEGSTGAWTMELPVSDESDVWMQLTTVPLSHGQIANLYTLIRAAQVAPVLQPVA